MSKNKKVTVTNTGLATQSNHLIEASYKMSVPAKRVMLMLLSEIHPLQQDVSKKIRIDAIDYAEKTGVPKKVAYRDIKKGCLELMRTIITTRDSKAKTTEFCVVVDWMKYHDNEGWLDAKFTPWIAPYIHHLSNIGYTTIAVSEALRFRRFYTVRLYELMMQFSKTGERYITLDDLREIFQIEKGKYPVFADLKKRVLNPSIKEIEEKTDWLISWDVVKKGREIKSLAFVFEKNDQHSFAF
jgi:plasmid replication initiation protein